MDDFNREKRLFTVDELKNFMTLSLDNYYGMDNSPAEFEDYKITEDAKVFVIYMNTTM